MAKNPSDAVFALGDGSGLLGSDFAEVRSQKRELLREHQARWESGDPVGLEEMLKNWPADPHSDPDACSLIFQEFLQRRLHGEEPSLREYEQRFPEHRDSLAALLSRHNMLHSLGGASGRQGCSLRLPEVGDEVFGFYLRRELGRGAFARVFLAEQSDLADRPVVLKVSNAEGSEPQTLAQLQHTHIVPIYSVHEDARAGLRVVCMPYFGGASLSRVLEEMWREGHPPDHGRQLVQALERVQDTHPEGSGDRAAGPDPWRRGTPGTSTEAGGVGGQTPLTLLSKLDYPRASAWIVARLAEGLQHAHQRGILHRDIKPSNILIGADGQPMLLDFNLAHDQKADFAETVLGGTVAYMAPEHLHALAGRTAALIGRVDHRSDIYSLGMVLHEMLTGQSPFQEKASYSALPLQLEAMAVERSKAIPSARQQRADLPWSLESILRKCLDPRPDRRYQQAEHLAEDLRRFLDDRPLKYAPELSQAERIRKWARRHPRLTSAGSVALATLFLLLTAAAALAAVSGRLASTTDELKTSQARERKQRYEAGTIRALCLVNTSARLQDHLRQGAGICEETLGLYGLLEGEGWQEPADWARLPAEDRRKLAEDTRELLLLLAGARVRLAPGDPAVLRSALALLDRAEAIPDLEPSRALWLDRAEYLNQLGRADEADAVRRKAEEIPAATARDHYLLATVHARRGDAEGHARALAELDQALRLNPRHYWSWVQKGICHLERGEDLQAARSFGACIGLWPDFAWGYFNHGYVLDRSGRKAEAIADYTAALARDPDLVPAYVNRGLARLELRQHEAALADFAEAQRRGKAEASLHAARGMALEALGRHAEADAAFRLAFAAVGTEAEQLRIRWTYGFAVSARLPEEARRAFDDVLRHDPRHAQALYGRAMLAMAQDRSAEALRFFDRALEADPGFLEARRYRAVLLARTGSLERASQDINWCLEREPRSGATLYAAACVAARAGQRLLDPGLTDQALNLLERALADGIDTQRAAQDPDLAGLRDHPRFKQLLDQPRGTREPGDQTVAPRR